MPENQRFEIVGFLALLARILWFDPRREHSSIPTANSRSRRAQGLSRLAASSRPPAGLGLDWPEHGGILDRIGAGGARYIIGKFKPLILSQNHAAGNRFGSVLERYALPRGFGGTFYAADFDFFRFVGHELFVSLFAFLLREQQWEIMSRLLGEPIPVRYVHRRAEHLTVHGGNMAYCLTPYKMCLSPI